MDSSFHAAPPSKQTLIERGRRWFETHADELRRTICPTPVAKRLMTDNTSDEVSIAMAICALISPALNPLIALAVAVLIMKRGLVAFCGE